MEASGEAYFAHSSGDPRGKGNAKPLEMRSVEISFPCDVSSGFGYVLGTGTWTSVFLTLVTTTYP